MMLRKMIKAAAIKCHSLYYNGRIAAALTGKPMLWPAVRLTKPARGARAPRHATSPGWSQGG